MKTTLRLHRLFSLVGLSVALALASSLGTHEMRSTAASIRSGGLATFEFARYQPGGLTRDAPALFQTVNTDTSFNIEAVRVESTMANSGSVPVTPPLSQVRVGETVFLSIYVYYDNVPPSSAITVRWHVTKGGSVVLDKQRDESPAYLELGDVWYHLRYTPSQPGAYRFTATVIVNGISKQKHTWVTAIDNRPTPTTTPYPTPIPYPTSTPQPPPSLSFDWMHTFDSLGEARRRFRPGDTLKVVGGYTVHREPNSVGIEFEQSYRYWNGSARRWIAGRHPLRSTFYVNGGPNLFSYGYTIPRGLPKPFVAIQITDKMALDAYGGAVKKSVVISIYH